MADRDAFFAIHSGLDREGPGSPESTRRALRLTGLLSAPGTRSGANGSIQPSGRDSQPGSSTAVARSGANGPIQPSGRDSLRVLDLGCGPGGQTMTLAEALPDATIMAVDLHDPFIQEVRRRAEAAGLTDRVTASVADMADVSRLVDDPVDLIWSEGAAYAMGFEDALTAWREVLRPGGHLALSEPVWAAPTVSQRISDFWTDAYPDMQPVQVRRAPDPAGPATSASATSRCPPRTGEAYYGPLRDRVEALRGQHRHRGDGRRHRGARRGVRGLRGGRPLGGGLPVLRHASDGMNHGGPEISSHPRGSSSTRSASSRDTPEVARPSPLTTINRSLFSRRL